MSPTKRGWLPVSAAAAVVAASQLTPAVAPAEPMPAPAPSTTASADPTPTASPAASSAADPEVLHNITYRARIDGVARGATITYAAEDDQTQTATPTMLPGRIFEANTVLGASKQAEVRVSIEWPYSANLHCEILVDDMLVAQADDFIAPRVLPNKEDPDYGALTCAAPVGVVSDAVPGEPPSDVPPQVPPTESEPAPPPSPSAEPS